MEIIVCASEDEVAGLVSRHICRLVKSRPDATLGFATGNTPRKTYQQLLRRTVEDSVSFAAVRAFMLDEYLDISEDHPARFRNELRDLLEDLQISETNFFGLPHSWPSGPEPDAVLAEACREFEASIQRVGGIDLQLLGISAQGHIAFNEPMSSLSSRTRVKTLTDQTRTANAEPFGQIRVEGDDPGNVSVSLSDGTDDVPVHVVTQGLGTILDSHHAVLIATGAEKAEIVAKALEGPLAAHVPASVLQLHPHATVVLDEAAAADLDLRDYYRQIQDQKKYVQHEIT